MDLHDYLQAAYVAAGFANATNVNSVDLHDYLQAAYFAAGFTNATNVKLAAAAGLEPAPSYFPLGCSPQTAQESNLALCTIHRYDISVLRIKQA